MSEDDWNMRQWATDHDEKDNFRFSIVWKVFGVVGTMILAVLGWSLKAQYDSAYATQQSVQSMGQVLVQELHNQTQHFDQER